MNWRVRFRNKTWLATFLSLIVGFGYNLCKSLGIVVPVEESTVMDIISHVLTLLGLLGVVIDPTTAGIGDSDRAMTYINPWKD